MGRNGIDDLVYQYNLFHQTVENTPNWFADCVDNKNALAADTHPQGICYSHQRLLHAAIGLSTESAELLDVMKKRLYGKEKPIDDAAIANLKEECGDVFFYLWLAMQALDYSFSDLLQDNITKLSARYNKRRDNNA